MSNGSRWLVGGCLGSATLIFALTLALSLAHDGADVVMVLRHAAYNLVVVLVMVALAAILYSQGKRRPMIYGDRESLRRIRANDEPAMAPDTSEVRTAQRYVEQLSRLHDRRVRRKI